MDQNPIRLYGENVTGKDHKKRIKLKSVKSIRRILHKNIVEYEKEKEL